jgi:hypothetical protein
VIRVLSCILLAAVLLSGCSITAPGPDHLPDKTRHLIATHIYDDLDELNATRREGDSDAASVWGFQRGNAIHYMNNDWCTFIHEVKHIYYGAWHPGKSHKKKLDEKCNIVFEQ